MSHGLLEILRYFLLALVWLFLGYGMRTVVVEGRRYRLDRRAVAARDEPTAPAGRPRAPILRLRVVAPPELKGEIFELGREVTLGRSQGCVVCLDKDAFASSLHARVFARDGEAFIEDLGSTNGTYLNDKRVAGPARLRRGDRVRVGNTVLEVGR